ncbi:MAG: ABC transporter ATP-binding protein [Anaerolineales bacterium]
MNSPAIRTIGLGKQYRLGGLPSGYQTLRDLIAGRLRRPFRQKGAPETDQFIWALRDVNLDVDRGQVLGLIGPNGAGKSTLLKLLSRVAEPTEGQIEIIGRVGSLLEVGTGFHPELTGRENIMLNGAILGMTRSEILGKFDEIVEFAEVEAFIDTPVKHYSTGMHLRLAFAVAAHLEPEILLVDEVLAVGDAAFQRKCIGKMGDVAGEGRTVVFVSHNMSAIARLTQESIVLVGGKIVYRGPTPGAIDYYLSTGVEQGSEHAWSADEVQEALPFVPQRLRIVDRTGTAIQQVAGSEPFWIEFEYQLEQAISGLRVGIYLASGQGEPILTSFDTDDLGTFQSHENRAAGHYVSRCRIPDNLLNEGRFIVGVNASSFGVRSYFTDEHALTFSMDGTGAVGSQWPEPRRGPLRPALEWEIREAVG